MELYEAMNEKIADIIAIDETPSSLYASAYIKDLRAENARLKAESADKERAYNKEYNLRKDLTRKLKEEKQLAETQLKELLSALYKRTEKPFTLERKDIVELAKDYNLKESDLNGKQ